MFILLSTYLTILLFIVGLAYKTIKYFKMPIHLRWELYPVPHEAERAHYGGSHYEETEWWKRPRKTSTTQMLKELLSEMLFIKRVFKYNRRMWYLTYSFHLGIYLLLIWFALLFIESLLFLYGGLSLATSPLGDLITIAGWAGAILCLIGTIGLLVNRAVTDLRYYSTSADYLNILFILLVLLTGILAWSADFNFYTARLYVASLVSFGYYGIPDLSFPILLHLVLLELLVIYIPFSKMYHFLGKFFTYHKVLWDDALNARGSKLELKVKDVLKLRVPWSAPHVKKGESWLNNATG